jgi:hypothetical protein
MKKHIPSAACWCNPLTVQLCPECRGNNVSCWRCNGIRFVIPYDANEIASIAIIHDHTLSTEMDGNSIETHYFMIRDGQVICTWERVLLFFGR